MDNAAIDAFVGNGPDSAFVRSLITPAPEDCDSELVTFIKLSNVIPDGVIKRIGSSIEVYAQNGELEHCGIASPDNIEFSYKTKYIELRDKQTISLLNNNADIQFNDLNMSTTDSDSDDEHSSGVNYTAFIKNTYKLEDPDTLVLPCSYIDIRYNYPCWKDPVTFTVRADDEIKGFTRLELMKKAMERYHLIYYLSVNYNFGKRIVDGRPSGLFSPGFRDYETNGVQSLVYDEKRKYWIFSCMEYD
jgi:hypothetical protein